MKIPVIESKQFILRPFKQKDAQSLKKYINNEKIYKNTLHIPYPYTIKDARKWLKKVLKQRKKKNPNQINFAIDMDSQVVGSIGLKEIEGHKAELGYWLAEKHWGKGIMTEAVKIVTNFGFDKLGLRRIYAYVFTFNKGSIRVLEKAGYKQEGILKKHVKKEDKFMDDYLFAKVK